MQRAESVGIEGFDSFDSFDPTPFTPVSRSPPPPGHQVVGTRTGGNGWIKGWMQASPPCCGWEFNALPPPGRCAIGGLAVVGRRLLRGAVHHVATCSPPRVCSSLSLHTMAQGERGRLSPVWQCPDLAKVDGRASQSCFLRRCVQKHCRGGGAVGFEARDCGLLLRPVGCD